jgi:hypothetical protein
MDEQEYTVAAELLTYCAGDDLFIGFVDEQADSRRQDAPRKAGARVKANQPRPPTVETTAQDEEDQAIALPHDHVTGAVEEGQRLTFSGGATTPNTPAD